jgi:hypothetical protein
MSLNQEKKTRKEPFRYKPEEDLVLLKEACYRLPWKADHGATSKLWYEISMVLKDNLSEERKLIAPNAISCQARVNKLIQTFKENERESLKKSGVDEEFGEREKLLLDIVEQLDEFEAEKSQVKKEAAKKELVAEKEGELIKKAALCALTPNSKRPRSKSGTPHADTPASKKKLNEQAFMMLKSMEENERLAELKIAKNAEADRALKEKELDVLRLQAEAQIKQANVMDNMVKRMFNYFEVKEGLGMGKPREE